MEIQNCNVVYRCPKTWTALLKTEDPCVRYCSECDRGVHLCTSQEELEQATKLDWCVAVDLGGGRPSPPRSRSTAGDAQAFLIGDIRAEYKVE